MSVASLRFSRKFSAKMLATATSSSKQYESIRLERAHRISPFAMVYLDILWYWHLASTSRSGSMDGKSMVIERSLLQTGAICAPRGATEARCKMVKASCCHHT
eukprot:5859600-Pleurochrysis_carterae.AAC.1